MFKQWINIVILIAVIFIIMEDPEFFKSFMEKPKSIKKSKDNSQQKSTSDNKSDNKSDHKNELSVSELTQAIKDMFKDTFSSSIKVKGEVYNCKNASAGHVYLSLRDAHSEIKAVIWGSAYNKMKTEIKNGDKIVATGKIDIYEKMGSYQFYISKIEVDGIGQLYEQYLLLKEKLELEGYFADSHKKKLPESIKHIGIITSSDGAVIHDMSYVLNKNNFTGEVTVKNTVVQGDKCPESVCQAIDYFHEMKPWVDVIIIARGGGSFQDLMGFSDESVVKAIYNSKIFTISAIGHESDHMLSDYVADARAGTPSIAAEIIIKNQTKLSDKMDITCDLAECKEVILAKIAQYKNKHEDLIKHLIPPIILLEYQQKSVQKTLDELTKSVINRIKEEKNKLNNLKIKLDTMSPDSITKNGFVMVYDTKTNKQIKSLSDIKKYKVTKLSINFIDGPLNVAIV